MRILLVTLGVLCLGLGFIGLFLPLLPTTPFVLAAAFCFARSSQRLHDQLINNKRFGPLLRQWQQQRTIPKRAKHRAMALIIASFAVSILILNNQPHLRVALLFIGVTLLLFVGRLPTQIAEPAKYRDQSITE